MVHGPTGPSASLTPPQRRPPGSSLGGAADSTPKQSGSARRLQALVLVLVLVLVLLWVRMPRVLLPGTTVASVGAGLRNLAGPPPLLQLMAPEHRVAVRAVRGVAPPPYPVLAPAVGPIALPAWRSLSSMLHRRLRLVADVQRVAEVVTTTQTPMLTPRLVALLSLLVLVQVQWLLLQRPLVWLLVSVLLLLVQLSLAWLLGQLSVPVMAQTQLLGWSRVSLVLLAVLAVLVLVSLVLVQPALVQL